MNWSKFPSAWILKPSAAVPPTFPLADLSWRIHRTQATASLLLLMAISIKLNRSHIRQPIDQQTASVAITYDELQDLTGFARSTVSKGLKILKQMDAVEIKKEGRANVYTLPDVEIDGRYCQLPQEYILDGSPKVLRRFEGVPLHTREFLNAIKLYVLFLALRNRRFNTTAVSYEGIMKYTGMRREDIPKAFSMLVALELTRATEDKDERENDKSRRYKVLGLHATG